MGRAVDWRDEEGPERTCVVTRVKGAPEDMIRFVAGPDNRVVPDVARRLPGRGVWLSPSAPVLAKALATKAFSRGLRDKVEAPADLPAEVDALLVADALQWLSLANQAGLVVAGYAKVEAAIAKGQLAALIHAVNAGADGVEKLGRALGRATGEGRPRPPTIGIFDSAQLDLALGRPHVIHAALTSGPAARTLLARCRRLSLFRGLAWADPTGNEFMSGDRRSEAGDAPDGRITDERPVPGIANE